MMKSSSRNRPERIVFSGTINQVRWNIHRNDIITEENEPIENWDYEYVNCSGEKYEELVDSIVRSRYSPSQVEAILSNFSRNKDVLEYLQFQAWRTAAKQIAGGEDPEVQTIYQVTLPLTFVLSGGKYEELADRILKYRSPYEIINQNGIETAVVYLEEILSEHEAIIAEDTDVTITVINLMNEKI